MPSLPPVLLRWKIGAQTRLKSLWGWCATWDWYNSFLVGGFVVSVTVDEPYVGLGFLTLAGLSVNSRLWRYRTSGVWKFLGTSVTLFVFCVLFIWTTAFMGNRPWSHLIGYWDKHYTLKNEMKSVQNRPAKPLEFLKTTFPVPRERQHPLTNSASITEDISSLHSDSAEGVSAKYIPSVDLFYDPVTKAFNFVNHGQTNIYLWGDQLDSGPKSIDEPRTITPTGAYHIWAESIAAEIQGKLGNDGEAKIPFDVYVTTEDKKKHVLKYLLWVRIKNGSMTIETQNLGTIEADFTKQ
jgi:hypothetical protein